MTIDRWTRVKSLYAEASELPLQVRAGFLASACAGDSALRSEVETLLRANEESEEFLLPPTRTVSPNGDRGESRAPHSRIGPYEIVCRLGVGGMGTVYLAERADGQVHTSVAVKVVKRGMDTEQILARFANERQALAELHHPNIASFLDAGMTEDGLPYIIMEYVDGERIDRDCAAHHRSVRERLGLFCQVCESVSYAHRNLFVHRDLKPSNILITASGEPKLLDFGLAKLLTPGAKDATRNQTSTEHRFLTPDYASPEQILGEHMTTTSDVYSLGVLLYKLLTGRPPHQFNRAPMREIERVLRDASPPAPSAIVSALCGEKNTPESDRFEDFLEGLPASEATPERLLRALRGDLDNILLKTISTDPARRYGSADQLREDIERYLGGLPVHARKDTIRYRAGKFVRRHRNMVVGSSAAVVLLIAGGVAFAWQAKVASDARERETRAQLKESALQSTLLNILNSADPGASEPVGAIDTLFDRFRTRIDRGITEPEIDAEVLEQFGRIYKAHGRYYEAARILRRAVGVRQSMPGERNAESMAASLHLLGAVLIDTGELDEARNVLSTAMRLRIALFGENDNRVAGVMDNLSEVLAIQGRYEEERAMFDRAEAIYSQTLPFYDLHMLEQSIKIANIMLDRGDLDAAQREHDEAMARVHEKLGDDDEYLVGLLLIEGRLLRERGDIAHSVIVHLDLISRLERMHGHRSHPDLAAAYRSAGETYARLGDHEQAIAYYDKALEMQRLLFGPDHPITRGTVRKLEESLRATSE